MHPSSQEIESPMPGHKRRKPVLAALSSFLVPGLGQLYNGQPRKALLLYFLSWSGYLLYSLSRLALSLSGLVGLLCLDLILLAVILVDAWRSARRRDQFEPRKYNRWYVYCLVIVVNMFVVRPVVKTFLLPRPIQPYMIPAASMLPTIEPGDRLVVHLNSYKEKRPGRGDIVVFSYPPDPSTDFIKRIIGLPGETIEIRDKKVLVNGREIDDPWGVHEDPSASPGDFETRDNFGPVEVPPGSYFVLGDNRTRSHDSRFWGFVEGSAIRGKALYIFWAGDKSRIGKQIR